MKRKSEGAAPIGMSLEAWAKHRKSAVVTRFGASPDNEQTSRTSTAQQPLTGSNQIPISGTREKLWQSRKSSKEVEDRKHDVVKNVDISSVGVRCGTSSNNEKTSCKSTVKQLLSGSNQIPISGIRQQLWQFQNSIDDVEGQCDDVVKTSADVFRL